MGCLFIDFTGQRFCYFVVVEPLAISTRRGNKYWRCLCDCGSFFLEHTGKLRTRKSCGCKQGHRRTQARLVDVNFRRWYYQYKNNAKKKGLSFDLSIEEAFQLSQSNCVYCGAEPRQHFYRTKNKTAPLALNGIDRKHNLVGYTKKNSVTCCSICNYAKRALPYQEFIAWLKIIGRKWAPNHPEDIEI